VYVCAPRDCGYGCPPPQDTVLFNGSIAENIAYGGPPNASLEDVQRAAREAQIHDHIINRFPQVGSQAHISIMRT
jgi:ABC-type multidrug transport system fused ATPase/permease subunit